MKQLGAFIEARSYWCPNCGTNLELTHPDSEWVLSHSSLRGQEFCPNWGKSFEVPTVALREKVFATVEQ